MGLSKNFLKGPEKCALYLHLPYLCPWNTNVIAGAQAAKLDHYTTLKMKPQTETLTLSLSC